MQRSVKSIISDTAQTMVSNETTTLVNRLLNQNAAREPLPAENPEDAEIAAGVLSLVQAPVKVVGGAVMIVGGVVLSLIPRHVMSVDTVEMLYQEDPTDEKSPTKIMTSVENIEFTSRKTRTPFHYTRKGEIHAIEDDQPIANIDVDQSLITRPRLPFIDPPEPVMDYTKENKPVAYAKTKTSVTGYGLLTTGLSTVISGAIDPVVGLSKSAFFGGRKLLNHIKSKREEAALQKDAPSLEYKRK